MYQRIKNSLEHRFREYCYQRLSANIPRYDYDYQELLKQGFYSQCGQDKWLISNLFKSKADGVFVDIGAHDGVSLSNSLYLERLGWSGVAVEPMLHLFEKLSESRECICINGCIAQTTGKRTFRSIDGYAEMLSGLVDEYDPKHLARIDREIEEHGGGFTDFEVDCFKFNTLMDDLNIKKVDYLSIDVEGVELKVLRSIDFSNIDVSVIGVENNYCDYRIPALLKTQGFQFHSIVGDEIYVNQNL